MKTEYMQFQQLQQQLVQIAEFVERLRQRLEIETSIEALKKAERNKNIRDPCSDGEWNIPESGIERPCYLIVNIRAE